MQNQNSVKVGKDLTSGSIGSPHSALVKGINRAMKSTAPFTKERNAALAQVRWVLRDQFGYYVAATTGITVELTTSINRAMVFDGRDNEEFKVGFYNSVTTLDFHAELL